MNTITTNKYLLSLLMIVSLLSCSRKTSTVIPEPQIELTINAPNDQSVFKKGDTVKINASINSPVDLHGYTWSIVRNTDGYVIASKSNHLHERTIATDDNWVNDVTETTHAELRFTVQVTHEEPGITKVKNITLNN